jgi:hypothetical protein
MKKVSLLAVAAIVICACGSSSPRSGRDGGTGADAPQQAADASQPASDGPPPADAPPTPPGDGGAGPCLAAADYGAAGLVPGQAAYNDAADPAGGEHWYGPLNQDAKPDLATVELYSGAGAFQTGLTTGTFQLTGDELNYATCSLCVLVWANVTTQGSQMQAAQQYLATGGSVTLTAVSGRITGTLSNVTFRHVTIDQQTWQSTPAADGCQTQIGSLSFDAPIS